MNPVEWRRRVTAIGKLANWSSNMTREFVNGAQSLEMLHKMAWAEDDATVHAVRQLTADLLACHGVVASRHRTKKSSRSYLIPELVKHR